MPAIGARYDRGRMPTFPPNPKATLADPKVKFRQKDHALTAGERARVVEVWSADETTLLGVLYPTAVGVKFVSKFITNHPQLVVIDPAEPPAVVISLEGLP
jgi:hypothetical protein